MSVHATAYMGMSARAHSAMSAPSLALLRHCCTLLQGLLSGITYGGDCPPPVPWWKKTENYFPKIKLCQHHIFHLSLIIFSCIYYYLTSEHLAPSSGLKNQLNFIDLLYKKLSLYLWDSLRIYLIKCWYLVSLNRYNIVTQTIVILQCISFFPTPINRSNPGQY